MDFSEKVILYFCKAATAEEASQCDGFVKGKTGDCHYYATSTVDFGFCTSQTLQEKKENEK